MNFLGKFSTKNYEQDLLIRTLMKYAKRRAKEKDLEFNIRSSDIPWSDTCPIFGTVFERNRGKVVHNSPSLDRVDSNLGYIPGNVRLISWRANQLKHAMTLDQARNLVLYMEGKI